MPTIVEPPFKPEQSCAEHWLLIFLEGSLNCIGYYIITICIIIIIAYLPVLLVLVQLILSQSDHNQVNSIRCTMQSDDPDNRLSLLCQRIVSDGLNKESTFLLIVRTEHDVSDIYN